MSEDSLTFEEATVLVAELTNTDTETIRDGAAAFDIAPPEEAEWVDG